MKKIKYSAAQLTALLAVPIALVSSNIVLAHPGGLNREGCHNDRKRGGYHCHNGTSSRKKSSAARKPRKRAPSRSSSPARAASVPVARVAAVRDETLRKIQQLLIDKGYDLDAADGIMGPKTRAALTKFYADKGVPQVDRSYGQILSMLESDD